MICPYCNSRNQTTAVICSTCGVILRGIKTAKRAPKTKVKRSVILRVVAIAVAAIVGGAFGAFVLGGFNEVLRLPRPFAGFLGALFGGVLIYLVSGARVLFLTNLYRARSSRLQSRIRHAMAAAEHRYEAELKKPEAAGAARLGLATAYLLQDEIEKSVQGFQQAQQQGVTEVEFFNNAGIALARRGSLTQSVEMFERALSRNGHGTEPRINLAHVFARTASMDNPELLARAIRETQAAIERDGSNPTLYNRLGLIYCQEKRFTEAFAQFNRAVEVAGNSRPAQADARNNLGIARFLAGDMRAAYTEFSTALRLDPGHGRALCNQGILLLLQNETEEAMEKLRYAQELDPRSALVRSNLGYGMCRAGAINDGIREFREAILLDTHQLEPFYNLGKVYTDEVLPDIADRYLTRSIQSNPHCWEALIALGITKMQLNQLPPAIQCFESAERVVPDQPLVLTDFAVALALAGQHEDAERRLHQAAELDPRNADIPAHMGWLSILRGNVSQGGDELQIALSYNNQLAEAHSNLGLCRMDDGRYDEALNSFRRALSINPDLGQMHYHLGHAFAARKEMNDAIKEWELPARAEPANMDCLVNLGVAYYQKGMFDEAATEFQRVIRTRQNRMEDFSNLALAYAKQGVGLRKASRNPQDEKAKQGIERQKAAIDMFDRALALSPRNVMLHSNRGLACYFANRAEEAMLEWGRVSQLDPSYAQKRGALQKSEFDDSQVEMVPLRVQERLLQIPPKTADFLYQLVPGYDTDEWKLIITDSHLSSVPAMSRQADYFQRNLTALRI